MCVVRKGNAKGDFEELFVFIEKLSQRVHIVWVCHCGQKDSVKRLWDLLLYIYLSELKFSLLKNTKNLELL
jgi:hypothetical protein